MPRHIDDYLHWQATETELNPFLGRFHWVLQTQLRLAENGLDVRLTNHIPSGGIVYSHVDCLDYGLRTTRERLVVAALVDKDVPLPWAVLHLTHNPLQRLRFLAEQRYMPPWPQIGLIPRDPARGDRFETLFFVGNREHLHPFFSSARFREKLNRVGLRLVIPEPAQWHDFSGADAVLAIRNFGHNALHLQRPALKLFNAWRAGVPALMGFETAYRAEGRVGVDYLEAATEDDAMQRLESLAHDQAYRAALVRAGHESASRFTDEAILQRWVDLFERDLIPLYASWRSGHWLRCKEQFLGGVRERLFWRYPGEFLVKHHP